jgi:hypothetical protein
MLHLVDINLFECMKKHGITNPKSTSCAQIYTNQYRNEVSTSILFGISYVRTLPYNNSCNYWDFAHFFLKY